MKSAISKILFLFVLNSLFWINAKGQVNIEMQIREIKAEYERINKDTVKFRIEKKDIFGQSSEGGLLEKIYDGKVLRKVKLTLFGENGRITSEHYFLNGELILVNDIEVIYKSPIYEGEAEIESRQENKYYFRNQKLIRWIGSDGKIMDGSLYPEKEDELLDTLKIIL